MRIADPHARTGPQIHERRSDLSVRRGVSLVDAFDPLRIVVFGSYAREEMHPSSDLDLLVVLPEIEHKRDAAVAMRRVLSDLPVSKDIVVATPEEIEARRESTWHIIARALNDGITVYTNEESCTGAIPSP